jgi:hypothetical protein
MQKEGDVSAVWKELKCLGVRSYETVVSAVWKDTL